MMKIILLDEASRICNVSTDVIHHFIEEEWINPLKRETLEMDDEDLARIRLIRDLKEDFGVNDEGMSIILHLLDQLNRIHLEIDHLHQGELL